MSLVGKKVLVTFTNWPIDSATYTYDGRDETGHFLTRKDGTQRHIPFEFVQGIELAESEVSETEF